MKDWTGTITSTFKTIGASNHTDKEREHNYTMVQLRWRVQYEEKSRKSGAQTAFL